MSYENGNGRDGDGDDFVMDVTGLKIKVERLEKEHDSHEEILQEIVKTNHILSERVVALEVTNKNDSKMLQQLQKESSIQTKLLTAILVALMGAAIKAVFNL
jgi:uncharacterized membrane protein YjjP (DUF1212 family)